MQYHDTERIAATKGPSNKSFSFPVVVVVVRVAFFLRFSSREVVGKNCARTPTVDGHHDAQMASVEFVELFALVAHDTTLTSNLPLSVSVTPWDVCLAGVLSRRKSAPHHNKKSPPSLRMFFLNDHRGRHAKKVKGRCVHVSISRPLPLRDAQAAGGVATTRD